MTNRTIISRGLAVAVALTSAQLAAAGARAADYNVGPIQITAPWARATPKGASSGAAYMTITNTGKTPDKVSCVSSDASARMPDPYHDHEQRRDADAAGRRRPRDQAG